MPSPRPDPHPSNVPFPNTLPPLAGSTLVIRGQFAHTLGGTNFVSGPSDLVSTLDLTSSIPAGTGSHAYFTSSRPIPMRLADPLVAFSPRGRIRLTGGSTHNLSGKWWPNVRGLFEYDADRDLWATLVPPMAEPSSLASSDPQALPEPKPEPEPQPLLPVGCSAPSTLFASTGSVVGQVVYAFGGLIGGTGPNPTYLDELRRVSMLDGNVVVEVLPKGVGEWPTPRSSALLLPVNDTHFLLSGGLGEGQKALGDWWLYDIGRGVWSKGGSDLIAARYSHRGVVYDERHVIQSGGWMNTSSAPLLESIDLFTGTVMPIPSQLAPGESDELLIAKHLTRHNTVLAGNQLLMYGGYAEFNDSLDLFKHNRRLYVASLSYASGQLTATWQSVYLPTLLLPPHYLRNGKPGDQAPWYALAIVLVAMAVSTLVLASVRGRLIGHDQGISGTEWWMWWRQVSESIGRKRRRKRQKRASRERMVAADSSNDDHDDHDDHDEATSADQSADALPHRTANSDQSHSTTLAEAGVEEAPEDTWPERNPSRPSAAAAASPQVRLSIFTTASTSSSLSPKTPPQSARTPPTRPSSSSLGNHSTTAASTSTASPASKPTVSVLPTPSLVRRGVGERVISVPEIVGPLPMAIPPTGRDTRGAGEEASMGPENEVGVGQVTELLVRPVVVGGSLASSRSTMGEGGPKVPESGGDAQVVGNGGERE